MAKRRKKRSTKQTKQIQQGYRVNQYRRKAIDSFEEGQSRTAYADLQQLRKVHRDSPKPLANSLRYVAKRISDPNLQSALRQAVNELRAEASRPRIPSHHSKKVSSQKVGVTRPLGFPKPQGSFPRNIGQVRQKQIQAIFDKLEKSVLSTQQLIEEGEALAQVGRYQAPAINLRKGCYAIGA